MSEKRNVPKLRFADFSEMWVTKRLEEYFTLQRGFDITEKSRTEGPYPVYSSSGISYFHNEFKVLGPGVITGRKGVVGNVFYIEEPHWPHDTTLWVKNFHDNHEKFVYFFLTTFDLKKFDASTSVPTLNRNSVHSVKISFPSLPEQQKIAEFLTAVDRRIELLQYKKEKLEAYKKGVMQKIFAQKLRFKADDGSEFPDWEERKLGKVLDYEQPTKYLVSSTEYSDNFPTPVLTAGKTFLLGYTDETTGIFNKNLPTIIFDDFTTAFQFVDFPFKAKSSAMKMLIPKESGVNIRYVFSAMLQIKYTPGDHKRHWISEFQEFEIPYPCEDEQTKIVQFLKSLDRSIDNLNQQITHTQTWKKGLLQKMFV